jgi:hypothetical protein
MPRPARQRGGELAAVTAAPAVTDRLAEAMAGYARAARAGNTWRAYEADLRHFAACASTVAGAVPRGARHGGRLPDSPRPSTARRVDLAAPPGGDQRHAPDGRA